MVPSAQSSPPPWPRSGRWLGTESSPSDPRPHLILSGRVVEMCWRLATGTGTSPPSLSTYRQKRSAVVKGSTGLYRLSSRTSLSVRLWPTIGTSGRTPPRMTPASSRTRGRMARHTSSHHLFSSTRSTLGSPRRISHLSTVTPSGSVGRLSSTPRARPLRRSSTWADGNQTRLSFTFERCTCVTPRSARPLTSRRWTSLLSIRPSFAPLSSPPSVSYRPLSRLSRSRPLVSFSSLQLPFPL
ncbi:hypothetical protein V8E36_000294, partial [Tilletia maclaganii]